MISFLNTDYNNNNSNDRIGGLTNKSKQMIDNAKWYLGWPPGNYYSTASIGKASSFYSYERKLDTNSTWVTSWIGKIGLIYPSDYGYATGGGTTNSREECLSQDISSWGGLEECYQNNWLTTDADFWTITPYNNSSYAMEVTCYAGIESGVGHSRVDEAYGTRPTIYLKSNIQIVDGDGSESNPYKLYNPEDKPRNAAQYLVSITGTDSLVSDEHPSTTQTSATTAYRYIGTSPANYVKFNDEIWRILGVYDVDDGTGKIEKRVKIISDKAIGSSMPFSESGGNNWALSSTMTLLNSGDYWNRTGSYSSRGLTSTAKELISDAKWYRGAINDTSLQYDNMEDVYSYERGSASYEGTPDSWVGKVGLVYPSDFIFSTAGDGSTTTTQSRENCLKSTPSDWSSGVWCASGSWLKDEKYSDVYYKWTITPSTGQTEEYAVSTRGLSSYDHRKKWLYLNTTPTVYLRADVKIIGGAGTSTDPYQLSL